MDRHPFRDFGNNFDSDTWGHSPVSFGVEETQNPANRLVPTVGR
jgi:hypothetical protein